jgi:hypothetical protein
MTNKTEETKILSPEERAAICAFLMERHKDAVKRIEMLNRKWK